MRRRSRTRRVLKWVRLVGSIAFVLTVIQFALPSTTVDWTGKILETRHGSPVTWMVIDMEDGQTRFHVKPIPLISDFLFYYLLVAFILWGGNRIRVDRRRRSGYCQKCGYDLTGNVSGICPECGRAI